MSMFESERIRYERSFGQNDGGWLFRPLKRCMVVGLLVLSNVGCGQLLEDQYPKKDAQLFLEDNGYRDITYNGANHFLVGLSGCDLFDAAEHEFSVTTQSGRQNVEVSVCVGLTGGVQEHRT